MSTHVLSVQEALQKLVDGNHRFQRGLRSVDTFHSTTRMKELAENGQSPFGVVLSCSDSRAPAEMIFDLGLGDLFVVRVAGNIVSASQIASIEFAALKFGSPLCVVMGHSRCGAVEAAFSVERNERPKLTPHLEKLVAKVRPAVRAAIRAEARSPGAGFQRAKDMLLAATWENVRHTVRRIRQKSSVVRDLEGQGKLLVVGAVYDLSTGRVQFDEVARAAWTDSWPERMDADADAVTETAAH